MLAQKNDMKGAIASYYDALNVRELLVRKTPGDDKLVQSFVDIRGKLADVLIPGRPRATATFLATFAIFSRV